MQDDDSVVFEMHGVSNDFKIKRLNIYRNAYKSRLVEVLISDFPALQSLIGETFFERLGHEYIERYPSIYFNIRDFTKKFPLFLTEILSFGGHSPDLIRDLALFEWHLSDAIDTGYDCPLGREDLTKIDPQQWPMIQFKLHSAARVINIKSNAIQYWQAYQAKSKMPSLQWFDEYEHWLIWRCNIEVKFRCIPNYEVEFLNGIKQGSVFGELCEKLVQYMDESLVASNSAQLLQRFLDDQLLVGDAMAQGDGRV